MNSKVGSWFTNTSHTYIFLTIVFKVGLQSYFKIVTTRMKWSTLQQHKETIMLCEEGMITVEARSAP